MKKIGVLGAGITGVTTAYQLMNKGYDVTVFEAKRYAAMETSFANGGQLSACNAEVWTNWKTIKKGLGWILKKDAPLLFNLKPSIHKLKWIFSFMGNIPNHKTNTICTTKMAIESIVELNKILKKENLHIDLKKKGILHLVDNKENFQHCLKMNEWLKEGGLKRYPVTISEIKNIEPTLNVDKIYGGFYTKSDMTGDIHIFAKKLADICIKKGVKFNFSSWVKNISVCNKDIKIQFQKSENLEIERFDSIVICAGVNSKHFADQIGDNVNIYPVKGYSITVMLNDIKSQSTAPNVSLLDDEAKIVTSRLGKNRLRIAGTAEFNGYNKDIRNDRIQPLINWCNKFFPEVSTEHCIPWTGLRPMTPSMMPKIGKGNHKRIYYNTGHGHLGWTLSAISSKLVSEKIERDDNLV